MRRHVRVDEFIAIGDHETVVERFDDGSDETIAGAVEVRLVRRARRFREARSFQELAADDTGVAYGRFVDGERVVR